MAGLILYNGKLLRRGSKLATSLYCCCDAEDPTECEECSVVISGGVFREDGTSLEFDWPGVANIRLTMPTAWSRLVRESETVGYRITYDDYVDVAIVRTGPSWVSDVLVGVPDSVRYKRGIDDLGMYAELRVDDAGYPSVDDDEPMIMEGTLSYDAHFHYTNRRNEFGYAWIYFDYCDGDDSGTFDIDAQYCPQSTLTDFCYKWAPECTECCYIFDDESQEDDDVDPVNEPDFGMPIVASTVVPVDSRVINNDESALATQTDLYGVSVSKHAFIMARLDKAKVCVGEETDDGIETENLTLEVKLVGPPTDISGTVSLTGWFFKTAPLGSVATYDVDGLITHLTWTALNIGDYMSVAANPYFFLCRKDPETSELTPDGDPPSELLITWKPGENCILPTGMDEFTLQFSESLLHPCDRTACCDPPEPCCCPIDNAEVDYSFTYQKTGMADPETLTGTLNIDLGGAWDCETSDTQNRGGLSTITATNGIDTFQVSWTAICNNVIESGDKVVKVAINVIQNIDAGAGLAGLTNASCTGDILEFFAEFPDCEFGTKTRACSYDLTGTTGTFSFDVTVTIT